MNFPQQTPLFHAEHSGRYSRQEMIQQYEAEFDCNLVVVIGPIFQDGITWFEDLVFELDPNRELQILLASPGGEGETAVRLVRAAQARCQSLTVIVPDQAKSAATLFALGADKIIMGPTSDLGPIDPQIVINNDLVAAKDILAAVKRAEISVSENPNSFPIHSVLLSDVTEIMVQQAQSILDRTDHLMKEALESCPRRTVKDVNELCSSLKGPLIDEPKFHGAIIGVDKAIELKLNVEKLEPTSGKWKRIWFLWSRYFDMVQGGETLIYEGRRVSRIYPGRMRN